SPAPVIETGAQIPVNDPMIPISAMAYVTKHLGFGVTFNTTYEPAFLLARRMSTLDHLTKGRIGWNIVVPAHFTELVEYFEIFLGRIVARIMF
ncbi:LLM class flavin-dependent oxidoreductase, partial [Rhizobium leguminosarum]|uniref:LLM class flavin-dependent oxidoreductase n=1 Tax=Rhizobium leguminosarum TaxID=384 RepID=UPI003F987568